MDQFEKANIKKMMEKDKEKRNKRLEHRKVRAIEKFNILSKQNIAKNRNQTRAIIGLTVILVILGIYQVFPNEVKFILNEIFDLITGKP